MERLHADPPRRDDDPSPYLHQTIRQRFSAAQLARPYVRRRLSVGLSYGPTLGVVFHLPHQPSTKMLEIVDQADHVPLADAHEALNRITALEQHGESLHLYPDAEAYIQRQLVQERLRKLCGELQGQSDTHPLRQELLKATLMPYQLEGIAFCVAAGRAILADDMGLGEDHPVDRRGRIVRSLGRYPTSPDRLPGFA